MLESFPDDGVSLLCQWGEGSGPSPHSRGRLAVQNDVHEIESFACLVGVNADLPIYLLRFQASAPYFSRASASMRSRSRPVQSPGSIVHPVSATNAWPTRFATSSADKSCPLSSRMPGK